MKIFAIILCFTAAARCIAEPQHAGDSPETLDWVKRTADRIEIALQDVISQNNLPLTLQKLMECHDEFEAIALAGIYCHEARAAAEIGKGHCNWLLGTAFDLDMTAALKRAQDAREQAHRMGETAMLCKQQAVSTPAAPTFVLPDVLRNDVIIIESDLNAGIYSADFHILAQKLEHAQKVFHEIEILAKTLNGCREVQEAAAAGVRACVAALIGKDLEMSGQHVQTALGHAATIKAKAEYCN
jgi:hypothetical protein